MNWELATFTATPDGGLKITPFSPPRRKIAVTRGRSNRDNWHVTDHFSGKFYVFADFDSAVRNAHTLAKTGRINPAALIGVSRTYAT